MTRQNQWISTPKWKTDTSIGDGWVNQATKKVNDMISHVERRSSIGANIGVSKLMTDTRKDAKDGGITDKDFKQFNKPYEWRLCSARLYKICKCCCWRSLFIRIWTWRF